MLATSHFTPERIADSVAASVLFAPLSREPQEVAAFAYLAADQRVLGLRHSRSGSVARLTLSLRDVAADALAFGATSVVMAHNHPSGDPTPSAADRDVTRLLARTLAALDIRLLDHLIVTLTGTISFRRLGLI